MSWRRKYELFLAIVTTLIVFVTVSAIWSTSWEDGAQRVMMMWSSIGMVSTSIWMWWYIVRRPPLLPLSKAHPWRHEHDPGVSDEPPFGP